MKLSPSFIVLLLYVSLCLLLAAMIEKDYTNHTAGTSYYKTDADLDLEDLKVRGPFFIKPDAEQYGLGYFSENLWIRLMVPGIAGRILEINKPSFTEADFYFPLKHGTVTHINRSGRLSFRTQCALIPDNYNSASPVYIRLQTPMAFNFEVRTWELKAFVKYALRDYLFFGIIYGILISIIIYNIILHLMLRKETYLYFFLFGLGTLMWCMLIYGHIDAFVPIPSRFHNRISLPVVALVWFASASFMRSFLRTRTITPRLDHLVTVVRGLSAVLCIMGLTGYIHAGHYLDTVLSYILPPFGIIIGVVSLKKGFHPAFWFLAGWTVFLIGTIVYALAGGPIPRNTLTLGLFASGAAFSALLLSYAMAYEMRTLQTENILLSDKSRTLRKISMTDSLTQLHNRASFNENLNHEIFLARQTGQPLALIMMDVDHFKKFNDTWGHPEGDRVLIAMGPLLSQGIRNQDFACRYGGEEFALILPGANEERALETAERIRKKMEDILFPVAGYEEHLTVSLGVAVFSGDDDSHSLTERADRALYRAKNMGRNRVCI